MQASNNDLSYHLINLNWLKLFNSILQKIYKLIAFFFSYNQCKVALILVDKRATRQVFLLELETLSISFITAYKQKYITDIYVVGIYSSHKPFVAISIGYIDGKNIPMEYITDFFGNVSTQLTSNFFLDVLIL